MPKEQQLQECLFTRDYEIFLDRKIERHIEILLHLSTFVKVYASFIEHDIFILVH